jgi:hypothetical protein
MFSGVSHSPFDVVKSVEVHQVCLEVAVARLVLKLQQKISKESF